MSLKRSMNSLWVILLTVLLGDCCLAKFSESTCDPYREDFEQCKTEGAADHAKLVVELRRLGDQHPHTSKGRSDAQFDGHGGLPSRPKDRHSQDGKRYLLDEEVSQDQAMNYAGTLGKLVANLTNMLNQAQATLNEVAFDRLAREAGETMVTATNSAQDLSQFPAMFTRGNAPQSGGKPVPPFNFPVPFTIGMPGFWPNMPGQPSTANIPQDVSNAYMNFVQSWWKNFGNGPSPGKTSRESDYKVGRDMEDSRGSSAVRMLVDLLSNPSAQAMVPRRTDVYRQWVNQYLTTDGHLNAAGRDMMSMLEPRVAIEDKEIFRKLVRGEVPFVDSQTGYLSRPILDRLKKYPSLNDVKYPEDLLNKAVESGKGLLAAPEMRHLDDEDDEELMSQMHELVNLYLNPDGTLNSMGDNILRGMSVKLNDSGLRDMLKSTGMPFVDVKTYKLTQPVIDEIKKMGYDVTYPEDIISVALQNGIDIMGTDFSRRLSSAKIQTESLGDAMKVINRAIFVSSVDKDGYLKPDIAESVAKFETMVMSDPTLGGALTGHLPIVNPNSHEFTDDIQNALLSKDVHNVKTVEDVVMQIENSLIKRFIGVCDTVSESDAKSVVYQACLAARNVSHVPNGQKLEFTDVVNGDSVWGFNRRKILEPTISDYVDMNTGKLKSEFVAEMARGTQLLAGDRTISGVLLRTEPLIGQDGKLTANVLRSIDGIGMHLKPEKADLVALADEVLMRTFKEFDEKVCAKHESNEDSYIRFCRFVSEYKPRQRRELLSESSWIIQMPSPTDASKILKYDRKPLFVALARKAFDEKGRLQTSVSQRVSKIAKIVDDEADVILPVLTGQIPAIDPTTHMFTSEVLAALSRHAVDTEKYRSFEDLFIAFHNRLINAIVAICNDDTSSAQVVSSCKTLADYMQSMPKTVSQARALAAILPPGESMIDGDKVAGMDRRQIMWEYVKVMTTPEGKLNPKVSRAVLLTNGIALKTPKISEMIGGTLPVIDPNSGHFVDSILQAIKQLGVDDDKYKSPARVMLSLHDLAIKTWFKLCESPVADTLKPDFQKTCEIAKHMRLPESSVIAESRRRRRLVSSDVHRKGRAGMSKKRKLAYRDEFDEKFRSLFGRDTMGRGDRGGAYWRSGFYDRYGPRDFQSRIDRRGEGGRGYYYPEIMGRRGRRWLSAVASNDGDAIRLINGFFRTIFDKSGCVKPEAAQFVQNVQKMATSDPYMLEALLGQKVVADPVTHEFAPQVKSVLEKYGQGNLRTIDELVNRVDEALRGLLQHYMVENGVDICRAESDSNMGLAIREMQMVLREQVCEPSVSRTDSQDIIYVLVSTLMTPEGKLRPEVSQAISKGAAFLMANPVFATIMKGDAAAVDYDTMRLNPDLLKALRAVGYKGGDTVADVFIDAEGRIFDLWDQQCDVKSNDVNVKQGFVDSCMKLKQLRKSRMLGAAARRDAKRSSTMKMILGLLINEETGYLNTDAAAGLQQIYDIIKSSTELQQVLNGSAPLVDVATGKYTPPVLKVLTAHGMEVETPDDSLAKGIDRFKSRLLKKCVESNVNVPACSWASRGSTHCAENDPSCSPTALRSLQTGAAMYAPAAGYNSEMYGAALRSAQPAVYYGSPDATKFTNAYNGMSSTAASRGYYPVFEAGTNPQFQSYAATTTPTGWVNYIQGSRPSNGYSLYGPATFRQLADQHVELFDTRESLPSKSVSEKQGDARNKKGEGRNNEEKRTWARNEIEDTKGDEADTLTAPFANWIEKRRIYSRPSRPSYSMNFEDSYYMPPRSRYGRDSYRDRSRFGDDSIDYDDGWQSSAFESERNIPFGYAEF